MGEHKPVDRRKADLAMIHIAKKDLGLDDQAYRDVLRAIGGADSSAKLDYHGRQKVLMWFRSHGWQPRATEEKKSGRARRPEKGSQESKILALWLELKRVGKLDDPTDKALDAFCKRMTGVERREWLTAAQANDVIEGLKAWLAR